MSLLKVQHLANCLPAKVETGKHNLKAESYELKIKANELSEEKGIVG
jgi:hypothetical protein